MARGYLRWSAKELADKAGVAESTIKRMEQDEGFPIARGSNIEAVYKALISAGIAMVPENGGGVGVRLAKPDGNAVGESKLRSGYQPAEKAADLAARAIEKTADKSQPAEEQKTRKRRLIKGPSEFRDIRRDQPKRKE
jgi:transcriptional regulator with XRE-family HTH domain